MKSIAELEKKAEAGYAAGHTEVIDLVRYIAGGEDLPTRLVAGTVAARVINRHKGDPVGIAGGVAKDLGKTAVNNAADNTGVSSLVDAAAVARDAVELPTRVLSWLTDPASWERIAYVIGGGVLILIAARLLIEKPAGDVVQKIVPVAKKLAAAKG